MILTLLLGLGGSLGWGLLGAWAQASSTRFSDPHSPRLPGSWRAEAEDTGREHVGRNWCPYQMSKLVTFIAACKTEKFLVHSQQPCPQGAPDCQKVKVMYRMTHKPVYHVKQEVLTSVAWRCCPGFRGPNCQHHDSTAILEPADSGDGHQDPGDGSASFEPGHPAVEISEVEVQQEQQERLLGDLQDDVHQMADSLPSLRKALASSLTAATMEANQTELKFPGRSLGQELPHVDAFLQVHFSPLWRSFNESLYSLSQAIRNLSLDVEANRQAITRVQDSAVARADLQELGAKFEAKVQENAQSVGQLRQDMENRLQAQRLTLHHSLSEVQAEVDTKLKRLHKAQEAPGTNGSLVVAAAGAGARPEPESLQARLGQLQRNLSGLHVATTRREEELQDMRNILSRHEEEIKELYSESDETFDQISKVERLVEELQVNHTALRELRVILMEKSLIMEENKEEVERQLLELNLTLQHLHGGHADLIKYVKDCNCRKLYLDLDVIREGQLDATRALEETQVSLDERRLLDGSSLQALRSSVDAVSQAGAPALYSSLEGLHGALSATGRSLEQHRRLFHSLFGNFQGLVETNVSLDLGKLQVMLSRKGKKQQKDLDSPRKRDKKQVDTPHIQGQMQGALGAEFGEAGSPVAFYASFSEGTAALQALKFNTTYINVGGSYFPEHGYFRAPERGVYLFAVSIEFGPGPGTGQLVFGGHRRTLVCSSGQKGGSTATTFAMAELQKGERVWFELTQGSVAKRSLPGTALGGFLMFKT
ncbi:multimerin-2 [Carlito syrichta]|uniref:Multimerin-2 n=1 Tax=Carlito syrichta TaxID=1868482 RepID=A0A1U7TKF3_CARSF|nr:multimerin-2 [Carlito syrichta]